MQLRLLFPQGFCSWRVLPPAALSRGAQTRLQLPPENGPHHSLAGGTWSSQRGSGPTPPSPSSPLGSDFTSHSTCKWSWEERCFCHIITTHSPLQRLWVCDFVTLCGLCAVNYNDPPPSLYKIYLMTWIFFFFPVKSSIQTFL